MSGVYIASIYALSSVVSGAMSYMSDVYIASIYTLSGASHPVHTGHVGAMYDLHIYKAVNAPTLYRIRFIIAGVHLTQLVHAEHVHQEHFFVSFFKCANTTKYTL